MKRKLLIFAIAAISCVCLAFGVSACGGNSDDSGTNNNEQNGNQSDGNTDDNTDDNTGGGTVDTTTYDEEVTEDGITYTLATMNGSKYYYVSGADEDLTTAVVKSEIDGVPVTQIDCGAFMGCTALESVTITDSITSIDGSAFYGCSSLETVEIPDSVTYIGDSAFAYCTSLINANIPDSVTYIGWSLFEDCTLLENVNICSGISSIPNFMFYGCSSLKNVEIPESITSIESGVFEYCSSLESIEIPEGVKSIGSYAFYYCASLKSITIPSTLTSIGNTAFDGCFALSCVNITDLAKWCEISFGSDTSYPVSYGSLYLNGDLVIDLVIPDGVTSIGSYAFCGCDTLISLTIPSSVTSIGEKAFFGCEKLVEVYNLSDISLTAGGTDNGYVAYYADYIYTSADNSGKTFTQGDFVFYYDNGTYYLIAYTGSDTVLVTPELTDSNGNALDYEIYDYAFYYNKNLTSVTITNGVTTIGKYAFAFCSSMTNLILGDNVTTINWGAFEDCNSLMSVTVGKNVKTIEYYAFLNCYKLVEVYNLSSLGITAYSGVYNGYGYVGYYALNVYTSASAQSKIFTQDDYIFYKNNGTYYLLGYNGEDKFLTLPVLTDDSGKTINYEIHDHAFYCCDAIISVTIPEGIEFIGECAFWGCDGLKSVTIPDSITYIGSGAFSSCRSLKYVYITDLAAWCNITFDGASYTSNPLSEGAGMLYLNGKLLTELVIPDGVTFVGDYAFSGCRSIITVVIPDGVTSISDEAFYECTSLVSISIPDSVISIGYGAFARCTSLSDITIGKNVTSIGSYAIYNTAYYNDPNNWEDGLLYIGTYLFNADTSLSGSVAIKDDTTAIAANAFYECKLITSVTIPEGITNIGDRTFYYCYALQSVTIPNSVTSVGSEAFYLCNNLRSVYYNGTACEWASISFSGYNPLGYANNADLYMNGQLVTEITLEGITTISAYAFYNCSSLESVTIGSSVTSIGKYAFGKCTTLTEINFNATAAEDVEQYNGIFYNAGANGSGITLTIGANVTKIPAQMFNGFYNYSSTDAPNITSVVFEANSKCASIGYGAFYVCTSLTSVTIPTSVTSIEGNAFDGCSSLKTVYYGGTEEQWNNISIESGNYRLTSADIIYSGGGNPDTEDPDSGETYTEYENGYYSDTELVGAVTTAEYLIIKDGTTAIAADALKDCTNLRFVYIPESVTVIGDGALDFTTSYDSWTTVIYFESSKGATSISTSYTDWLGKYSNDTTVTYQGVSFTSNAYGFRFLCVGSCKVDGDYIYRTEDGLSHASTSSSASAVTYAYFGTDTVVTVPSTLGGYTVGTVSGYTFAETDVTSVTLPSSVIYIGSALYLGSWGGNIGTNTSYNYVLNWMPFTACDKLTTVNINGSVAYILGYSFSDSTALTTINFASDCQGVAIYNHAFDGCTSLTSLTLPELAVIYSYALQNSSITSVTAGGNTTATICSLTVDTSTYTYSYNVLTTVNQGTELAAALKGTYLNQDVYLNYDTYNS